MQTLDFQHFTQFCCLTYQFTQTENDPRNDPKIDRSLYKVSAYRPPVEVKQQNCASC